MIAKKSIVPREWVGFPEFDTRGQLPPDLTTSVESAMCDATHDEDGYVCTRLAGHGGRHAAGNSEVIVAVWS